MVAVGIPVALANSLVVIDLLGVAMFHPFINSNTILETLRIVNRDLDGVPELGPTR
jgi:hypothetical protein